MKLRHSVLIAAGLLAHASAQAEAEAERLCVYTGGPTATEYRGTSPSWWAGPSYAEPSYVDTYVSNKRIYYNSDAPAQYEIGTYAIPSLGGSSVSTSYTNTDSNALDGQGTWMMGGSYPVPDVRIIRITTGDCPPPEQAPVASDVSISGTAQVAQLLTGNYTYSDANDDPEGASTFRWVRNAVNTDVAGGSDVGTAQTYTPVEGDVGSYLYFCVTPVASTGKTTGVEACSPPSAQVTVKPPLTLISDGSQSAQVAGGQWEFAPRGTGPTDTRGFVALAQAQNESLVQGTPPNGLQSVSTIAAFRLITGAAGTAATVTLDFGAPLPDGAQYWKYGPQSSGAQPEWYAFPGAQINHAAGTVTLTLTDGQLGDADWLANSVISDPGGFFIAAAPGPVSQVPTLNQWGTMLLSVLLALGAIAGLRRQVR